MRRIDRTKYDFRTDTWIRDDFLSPKRETASGELTPPATLPAPGRWKPS